MIKKENDQFAASNPILTKADHQVALARIDALIDAVAGSPDGRELSILADLVEAYEAELARRLIPGTILH